MKKWLMNEGTFGKELADKITLGSLVKGNAVYGELYIVNGDTKTISFYDFDRSIVEDNNKLHRMSDEARALLD